MPGTRLCSYMNENNFMLFYYIYLWLLYFYYIYLFFWALIFFHLKAVTTMNSNVLGPENVFD